MEITHLVRALPKDSKAMESPNLGYDIVAKISGAKEINWWDNFDDEYGIIGFNIFYMTHILNAFAFMNKNNIPFDRVVFGGQGITNTKLKVPKFVGEYDGEKIDKFGFNRCSTIASEPLIKGDKAVVELARGCKYRCKFCEYAWVQGGKYREKDFDLVKEQIDYCVSRRVKRINFMSVNIAGYSKAQELFDYCEKKGIGIINRDICLQDIDRVWDWIRKGKINYLKIGVESFDEKTRIAAGKNFSDERLGHVIDKIFDNTNSILLYLIYGLPNDNYSKWFEWLKILNEKRNKFVRVEKNLFWEETFFTKNTRVEMNITNFEPCIGTPYENMPFVDFKEKDKFLVEWTNTLQSTGLWKTKSDYLNYKNGKGRFGRKELSYQMLMALKNQDIPIEKIFNLFPNGISRSIKDKPASKFLNAI